MERFFLKVKNFFDNFNLFLFIFIICRGIGWDINRNFDLFDN